MKVKSILVLAERCHYHHTLRDPMLPSCIARLTLYIFNMAWREFANKQKCKRTVKGKKQKGECSEARDEIVVQRMSSDVSGKQQKYSRSGAQEYVRFEYDELNFDNIKDACQKHFAPTIEKDLVCDILAGKRGPSCKKITHIPNMKVFYVRFVKPQDIDPYPDDEGDPEQTSTSTREMVRDCAIITRRGREGLENQMGGHKVKSKQG